MIKLMCELLKFRKTLSKIFTFNSWAMGSYNKIILFVIMLPLFTASIAVGGLQTAYGGDPDPDPTPNGCDNNSQCSFLNDACVVGVCNAGECVLDTFPDGSSCGDSSDTICDDPDSCLSGACVDNFEPNETVCRFPDGVCDVAETCTGSTPLCPVDEFSTDSCRASTGVCDVEEFCDGSSASCPDNEFQPPGTVCSCSAGSGTCDGNNFCIKDISIDIKPGSDPNSINTRSMGVVPVAILGSETFDVGDVDETTLMFGTALPAHDLTDPNTYNEHIQDVNDDGFDDLVSHYKQKDTGILCIDTEATLTGELLDGTPIEGIDSVNPKCRP